MENQKGPKDGKLCRKAWRTTKMRRKEVEEEESGSELETRAESHAGAGLYILHKQSTVKRRALYRTRLFPRITVRSVILAVLWYSRQKCRSTMDFRSGF